MTYKEFVELLEERGDLVFIADRGLVRFGKFVAAAIAIFSVVGLFLFGARLDAISDDISKKAEEVKQVQLATQESQVKLGEARLLAASELQKIADAQKQLEASGKEMRDFIEKIKAEATRDLEDIGNSQRRALNVSQTLSRIVTITQERGGTKEAFAEAITTVLSVERTGDVALPVPATINVVVVSQVQTVKRADMERIAAALQKQVTRDLKPAWGLDAALRVINADDPIPAGSWPIYIRAQLPAAAGGYHLMENGRPYAVVAAEVTDINLFSYWMSRELLNMLVDPEGNRTITARSVDPKDNGAQVDYLVEIASTVGAVENSYKIDGITVSDFVLPDWFKPGLPETGQARLDFTGGVKRPLQLLKGSYVSWLNRANSSWYQSNFYDGTEPVIRLLGPAAVP